MVRPAVINDLDSINAIGEEYHDNFKRLFHLETEFNNQYSIILVSENNSIINGYLYAYQLQDNIDLLSIVVASNYRNKHVGTDLLSYLINHYKGYSITLEVATDNIKAINLYQKFAFKVENTRKKYYNNTDAYLMRRTK